MDVREKLVELLDEIHHKPMGKTYKERIESIADHLIAHGVTVQDNTEISDELLKQLRNAPLMVLHEEPTIELVQQWISVKDKLPDFFGTFLVVVEEDDPDNTLYTDCADYDPFEKSWRTFGYFDNGSRIKLWMPLPQPPKGE